MTLSGIGKSGPLDIELRGDNNTFTEHFNSGISVGEGTYSVTLNRPLIPEDRYSRIVAVWRLSSGIVNSPSYSLSPLWRVLGIVRHSQYNAPTESACTGSPQEAWVFNDSCSFTQTTLDSQFFRQVQINGTGQSRFYGFIKTAYTNTKKCSGSYPDGATTGNSFFLVTGVIGCCNMTLNTSAQAAFPNPKLTSTVTPKCGDNTLLVESNNSNFASKWIADYCPACSDGHHIDNFTDNTACTTHEINDLGNYWTANVGH